MAISREEALKAVETLGKYLLENDPNAEKKEEAKEREIIIRRVDYQRGITIGEMKLNFWTGLVVNQYCLEDKFVEELSTVEGSGTAIAPGVYRVVMRFSTRFGRELPALLDVPGRSGILIHPGNTEKDTTGCILPGTDRTKTGVLSSRTATEDVIKLIREYERAGLKVTLAIS